MPGLIDLHSHTTESDGTLTPGELVSHAHNLGLAAIAITDHDTFKGFEQAEPVARELELELVRGIELNTRTYLEGNRRRSVHLLAYFLNGAPRPEFTGWLSDELDARQSRNADLVENLQKNGVDINLDEVSRRGRTLAGRPHFANILVEKGYASSSQDAYQRYLGEQASSFVERKSKTTEEVIGIVRDAGGIPVIAHPVRLRMTRDQERALLLRYKEAGLMGVEIYHSEHPPELQAHYRQLAEELDLLPTGGSDFHGQLKPAIELGTGANGNVRVPAEFLVALRRAVTTISPATAS